MAVLSLWQKTNTKFQFLIRDGNIDLSGVKTGLARSSNANAFNSNDYWHDFGNA